MNLDKAEKIIRHCERIKVIFPKCAVLTNNTLYKRLSRLEAEAVRLAERECNEQLPEGYSGLKRESILRRLDSLLDFSGSVSVFVNTDPRGYGLKIKDGAAKDMIIERDMGGYGIICPEF